MNDRPRQNPAYRLTRYAPRQGGFPPYQIKQPAEFIDLLASKKPLACVFWNNT